MKSIQKARIALVVVNVALAVVLGLVAKATFFEKHEAHLPGLDLKRYTIEGHASEGAESYSVIWKELDKVPPPPPPPAPSTPAPPGPDSFFKVALIAVDPAAPGERFCILQPLSLSEQLVLRAGETHEGWTCTSIEPEGRDWLVALKGASGTSSSLRLQYKEN